MSFPPSESVNLILPINEPSRCRDKDEVDKVENSIADFTLLHLSPAESVKVYKLMLTYSKSHGMAIPDALVAATAIAHDLELAGDNERHFSMISDLIVKRPY